MSPTTRYSVMVVMGEILALTLGRMQLSGAMLVFFGIKNFLLPNIIENKKYLDMKDAKKKPSGPAVFNKKFGLNIKKYHRFFM
jgi:hypothetical protein